MQTKRLVSSLTLFSVVLFSTASLRADTLAYWDMQATPSTLKTNAVTVGSGLTASGLASVNLSAPGGIDFGASGNHYIAWSRSSSTGGNAGDLSLDAVLADATYFSFTLTPNAGQSITVNSLSFDCVAGTSTTTATREFFLLSNKTGYTDSDVLLSGSTQTGSPLIPFNNGSETLFSVDLSGNSLFQNISDSVTFRFYIGTDTVSQNLGFDNLTVNGLVAPVPEPSTLALLGLGGLTLMAVKRRHRQA